jgi:hypothetical protein
MAGYATFPWRDDRGAMLTVYGRWPGKPPEGRPKTNALPNPKDGDGNVLDQTKRSPLYLDRALRGGHQQLVLVEGVIDAALAQARGDTRVIACVAAQLSAGQVQTLKRRGAGTVVIALDPDNAGDGGILSCVRQLHESQIRAYVAPRLPDGLDPDEFILRDGIDAWRTHVGRHVHGFRAIAKAILARHGEREPGDDAWADDVVEAAVEFARAVPPDRWTELEMHFFPEIASATGCSGNALISRAGLNGASDPAPAQSAATPGLNSKASPPGKSSVPVVTTMYNVKPESPSWLWKPWILRGAVNLLDGDPGRGKSTIAIDLAARVSRGWGMPPGGGQEAPAVEPADVLLLSAEDSLAQTIRPRLAAAGADLQRVHALEGIRTDNEDRPPVLPFDLGMIETVVTERGAKLVVVDPLMAYLDGEVDAHRDQDVRRVLHHLKMIAERTGAAFLVIRHLNKNTNGAALYRGGGSIGIIGAARSALVVGQHPKERDQFVLAPLKCNLAKKPKSLTYSIETVGNTSRIGWGGECELTADEILEHHKVSAGERCAAAIKEFLGTGTKSSDDLEKFLKNSGFTTNAIKAGRKLANVKVQRAGYGKDGKWMVRLFQPGQDDGPAQDQAKEEQKDQAKEGQLAHEEDPFGDVKA